MGGLVIGLGTGRCGTRSMTKLFKEWGLPATHEKYRLNWNPDKEKPIDRILNDVKCDVGYYWLYYVPVVLSIYPDAKFVCFKREKELVIKSYTRGIIPVNPIYQMLIKSLKFKVEEYSFKYSTTVTDDELEKMDPAMREAIEQVWDEEQHTEMYHPDESVPQRKVAADLKTCVSEYYDEYYVESERLAKKYPDNFKIFDMLYALNTEDGRNEVKNFIGVTPYTMAQ